jgi:aspartyl-tRNA(Asn)/glutamyl-tRNA(Gln) amidotransferase subunit A
VTAEQVARCEPSVPAAEVATAVVEGADEYNGFAYECETGSGTGALDDLTLAVKDNMAVSGVPMTGGSDAVAFRPTYDSTVVRRLEEGGATVVGTTNRDVFARTTMGEACGHDPVENPTVEGRVPGGSSSGSAVAVR